MATANNSQMAASGSLLVSLGHEEPNEVSTAAGSAVSRRGTIHILTDRLGQ
jgi:hypothetical protein